MTTPFKLALIEQLGCMKFTLDDFEGCTEAEIALAMAAQGVKYLPPSYIEFMHSMGRGGKTEKSRINLPSLYSRDEIPLIELKEAFWRDFKLCFEGYETFDISNIFVIKSVEQYVFLYFYTEPQIPEPQVYLYREGMIENLNKTISEYIITHFDLHIKLRNEKRST